MTMSRFRSGGPKTQREEIESGEKLHLHPSGVSGDCQVCKKLVENKQIKFGWRCKGKNGSAPAPIGAKHELDLNLIPSYGFYYHL
jgi:hypothetical protein